ncbi:hypothetical protein LT493_26435 [Streptomyces tricolor]|nr:hypothetical protein [Streptomyces tricolor]
MTFPQHHGRQRAGRLGATVRQGHRAATYASPDSAPWSARTRPAFRAGT